MMYQKIARLEQSARYSRRGGHCDGQPGDGDSLLEKLAKAGTSHRTTSGRYHPPRRLRRAAAHAGALVALLSAAEASGQCQYEVTVIKGPFCGVWGYPPIWATGLNDAGTVVGFYWSCTIGPARPFTWSQGTGLTSLPIPTGFAEAEARDVNERGTVVGRMRLSETEYYRAVLWQDGNPLNLGTLPGGNCSEASAVNASGQVVGSWGHTTYAPPGLPNGFVWQNGRVEDLQLPMGPQDLAQDINDSGQITGWMGQAAHVQSHAYVWKNGKVVDLGVLPGGFAARGWAINSYGDVVGAGLAAAKGAPVSLSRGFYARNGSMTDLGTVPGFTHSSAKDINDRRQVVGATWFWNVDNVAVLRAFVWQNGYMTLLNDLIPPESGIYLHSALTINNAGQIAGQAVIPPDVVAYILTPTNVPQGDLDLDCRVGIVDLLELLSNWGSCARSPSCFADLDGDGSVDELDLLVLVGNWG